MNRSKIKSIIDRFLHGLVMFMIAWMILGWLAAMIAMGLGEEKWCIGLLISWGIDMFILMGMAGDD